MSKTYQQRTLRQNKALHKFFEQLADEFSQRGLDMRKTLKESVDIPWTPQSIKEFLFKPIMKAQLSKESTTDLTTVEIDQIFDTINRHLAEKFQFSVPFPSIETLLDKQRENEI